MRLRTLLPILFLALSTAAHATHVPPFFESVVYDGTITAADTGFSGSLTDSDGYDFYAIDVLSGQSVVFDFSSTTLLPNIHVYDGIGVAGDTVGSLGEVLYDYDNSVTNSISGITWEADMDYSATLVISTWLGEVGDYNLTVVGAAPEETDDPAPIGMEEEMDREPEPTPEMGDPSAVPEPASLVAWALLCACVAPIAWRRRK